MTQDAKIWNDFRKGENKALSRIYFQNIQMLYQYGRKFTTDDELVKDTIQDMFYDLITHRNTLGDTDNVRFYLMASFRRKLSRSMRRNKLTIQIDDDNFVSHFNYSAEHELINKETLTYKEQKVREALASLSPKQREILYYKFTCDFDYEQICDIMNLHYDSARKQVYRAIKSMRKMLYTSEIYVFFLRFH